MTTIAAWPTDSADNIPYTPRYITGKTWTPNDVLSTPTVAGTTYYVDGAAANDSGDGSIGSPKKLIASGLGLLSAGGGDRLLIRGAHDAFDGVYREQVLVTNPCVVGPYNGETVIIDGGLAPAAWTDLGEGNNIWYRSGHFTYVRVEDRAYGSVVVDWKIYYPEASLDDLRAAPDTTINDKDALVPTNQRFFNDVAGDRIYLRTADDPNNHDVGLIQHNRSRSPSGQLHITADNAYVYGLIVRFSPNYGIYSNGDNVTINHCQNLYSANTGINMSSCSGSRIEYTFNFSPCMDCFPRGIWHDGSGGWGAGTVLGGCTSCVTDGNVCQFSHGEGFSMLTGGATAGNIGRNNYALHSHTGLFYIDSEGGDTYDSNYGICIRPTTNWHYPIDKFWPDSQFGSNKLQPYIQSHFGRSNGVGDGREGGGTAINNTFSNNIIINSRTFTTAGYPPIVNRTVINNTFIGPTSDVLRKSGNYVEGDRYGLWVNTYNAGSTGNVYKNNIFIQGKSGDNTNQLFTYIATNEGPPGYTFDHNLWYTSGTTPFWIGSSPAHHYNHADWITYTGYTDNDQTADPKLASTFTEGYTNQIPASDSPAINTGTPVSNNHDFLGVSRPQGGIFDIGAFEYQQGIFSRGDYPSLPADDTDLENIYTVDEVTDVATDDDLTYVDQVGDDGIAIHQFKAEVTAPGVQITWNGQSTIDCGDSTVYLQIYNRDTSTWDTIDFDDSTAAGNDFNLQYTITDLDPYWDENNIVSCRVYQETP